MPKCIDCKRPVSPNPYCEDCAAPEPTAQQEVLVVRDSDGGESVIATLTVGVMMFILGAAFGGWVL